jgi:hypothetical protein
VKNRARKKGDTLFAAIHADLRATAGQARLRSRNVTVSLVPRRCEGCSRELPPLARANRRYHGAACRAKAARRRRRERVERELGGEVTEAVLLAQIAKAAAGGSWRASVYLLERLYGRGAEAPTTMIGRRLTNSRSCGDSMPG